MLTTASISPIRPRSWLGSAEQSPRRGGERLARPPGRHRVLALLHRLPHNSTQEVDALLTELEHAYRAMDVEAFASLFTEDVEQLDVNRRVSVRGARHWRRQTEDVNGAHVWMERNYHGRAVVGNQVVLEVEWAGRVRGQAVGTPKRP